MKNRIKLLTPCGSEDILPSDFLCETITKTGLDEAEIQSVFLNNDANIINFN